MPPSDDERERPSWREIDQRRDRSGGARPRREPRLPKKQSEMIRLTALAQAEALFQGKRAKPEYQKDLRELESSHGTRDLPPVPKGSWRNTACRGSGGR